ncbi:MAG: Allantoicase [Candelina mexicana]|nr:MAG: Allantoicase [Candelina mexicana]
MEVQTLSPEVIQDTITSTAQTIPAEAISSTFEKDSIDLISYRLNSRILSFSDEWFASASNLLTPTPPIRKPNTFTHAGAWYDGWETRRHNPSPFDWVIIRLGVASGRVRGVEIDTAFFDGNHAPEIAVEGCFSEDDGVVMGDGFEGWETVLGKRACGPNQRQAWVVDDGGKEGKGKAITHVRLCMFPDGGIARFRLYGSAVPVFPNSVEEEIELSAAVNGGVAVTASDQHFGARGNLLLPGRGVDMGDGWETKRSRGEGHVDWVVVRLGARGRVNRVVVDTAHFRGNYPKGVRVEGILCGEGEEPVVGDEQWVEVVGEQSVGPDVEHVFGVKEVVKGRVFSHMKLVIVPDGGVKRFRVFGTRDV